MTGATKQVWWAAALSTVFVFSGCNPENGNDGGTCAPGTQGCECVADKCGKTGGGEQLICMGGTCEVMACPAGERGCVCRGGSSCNAPGDACTNGFCIAADCTPSSKDCSCIAGSCDVGLTCVSDTICVDNKGYEGGACLDTGRCYRGARCDNATNQCVFCDPGTTGCQCRASGGCNAGLSCAADLCVSANQLPPANPVCYTPCRADLVRDGQTVQCGADGLLDGCLENQTCTNGSCLGPTDAAPTCSNDLQCPFFQVCLQGSCYSNCSVNADCSSGQGCFKRACRTSCRVSAGQAACGAGLACVADDGENGFCLPVGTTASASTAPQQQGGLRLPISRLDLSNVKPAGDFIVVPQSTITQDVTVRRLWHEVSYADGRTERVDAPLDAQGAYRSCNAAANECPLWWLNIGAGGSAPSQAELTQFRLSPDCVDDVTTQVPDAGARQRCPRVAVSNAAGVQAVRWQGALELASGSSRTQIFVSYVERPEGQWTGAMYYFGTFDSKGMTGPTGWIARSNKNDIAGVDNALVQRWGAFRLGGLQGGWQEYLAVLTATRTESWKYSTVKEKCLAVAGAGAVCYPYTNTEGVRRYVANPATSPVPSGVSELPVGLNLKLSTTNPAAFEGRIESSLAMHYPGNPEIKLEFAGNPADINSCFSGGGSDCVVFLKGMDVAGAGVNTIVSTVGGRYVLKSGSCANDYVAAPTPWMVPGFEENTSLDMTTNTRVRTECRESKLPFDTTVSADFSAVNQGLAGGNPVPNGAPVQRTLRFIDGALINQTDLFLLFEESYDNFIPGQAQTTAYGYMRLTRAAAALEADDYKGRPVTTGTRSTIETGSVCSESLLASMRGRLGLDTNLNNPAFTNAQLAALPDTKLEQLTNYLLDGRADSADFELLLPAENNLVSYWCSETGLFNGGAREFVSGGTAVQCPVGSEVIFFRTRSLDRPALAALPCQTAQGSDGRATCRATLEQWRTQLENNPGSSTNTLVEYAPTWRCTNSAPTDGGVPDVYCDDNRANLREGKTFLKPAANGNYEPLVGLRPLIDSAFRYKTRFTSTSGGTLGFAPTQCPANSDAVPYCYSPAEIEQARARLDCLISIYKLPRVVDGNPRRLTEPTRLALLNALRASFSHFPRPTPTAPLYQGFERLYAELLIMQGDEALTAAYASRFDLAAAGGASFQGSKFEKNGIDLTGVAGAEMYNLYLSTQYYQLALDRLYNFGPDFQVALSLTGGSVSPTLTNNFVSPDTVTDYLERLVRAAAQKSRAWGEIARRYQNFNRPDLARAVIERAYVTTYLESALIARLMLDISDRSGNSFRDQIRLTIEKSQRTYRMALLDMRDVYGQITDSVNYFGYPPEYIPFPALDSASTGSGNAFEVLSNLARQRLDLARTREQIALSSAKQGRVDAAQFQSDLTSIRNTYENQLAQACGVFTGADGRVYPAIRKYAHQSQQAMMLGDPCGRMGNGDIHNAIANVKDSQLRLQGVLTRNENIFASVEIERERVAEICQVMKDRVDFTYNTATGSSSLQKKMADTRAGITFAQNSINAVMQSMQVLDCEIQCFSSIAQAAVMSTLGIAAAGAQYASELKVATAEKELRDFEATNQAALIAFDCGGTLPDGGIVTRGQLQIESQATIKRTINESLEVQVEALRAEYSMRVAAADVARAFGNAQRLQAQQEEAEQLAIDVQQAQNDPNVRIYQNDAVINADVSFQDALATAYRLTRVYEYYTSQSYARKEQLFLIRMVSAGQYNLENYLLQLENEFNSFEEDYGNPDLRVQALSLRDDIMKIPYLGTNGRPLSEADRIQLMRDRLKDVKLLDSRGYLTLPFSTSIEQLSPLTRNHKIRHVEVDLQGVKLGDSTARVYLRMSGTGVVRSVTNTTDFYVFPERLAVINASLLGSKVFDPEVYRNYRFRDRPMVNTLWELVLNLRDEPVNKDIDLQTLTDVRVLVYYSDFTSF